MSRSPRTAVSAVLIALACLLVPFGTLAAWAAYGLTDTGRYVTTMAPLASDPAVRDVVADTVGDDVARASGLNRVLVRDAVRSFTGTRAYRTAWDAANEAAHTAVMRALRDDHHDRPVTLDLASVTAPLKRQLAADHLPFAAHIPVEHRGVALFRPDQLAVLRKGYHVLDFAAVWLPSAAVLFAVTGIAVAACRRRALTATALGTALGGAFLGLAVAIGRRLTLADLPDPAHRPAAAAVYDALTATLRTASWLLLTLGLTVATAVWLTHRLHVRLPQPRRRAASAPTPVPPPHPTRAQA